MNCAPYVRKVGKIVRIGNGILELGFDARAKGGLVSIRDKKSRWEFLRDPQPPKTLFRVGLRRKDADVVWFDSRDARRFGWEVESTPDGGKTLRMRVAGFPKAARLAVEVEVAVDPGCPLSKWRLRVGGVPAEMAVCQVVCPVVSGALKVGDHAPGECIATPRQSEGYVFSNPYPVADNLPLMSGKGPEAPAVGMGELYQVYPGSQSMQLLLYYNDHAGLYLATHDGGMHVKAFACGRMADWGDHPVMSIQHLTSETPGGDVSLPYDTMLGVFHGDWYDGADIYKAWARRQWWCARKLSQRDIGPMMRRGFGVWQMSNYHIPKLKLNHSLDQIATEVNALSKEIGAPLLALIFNFEKGGAWTGPVGFYPPKEGEKAFHASMKKLRAAGNHGFIYMPGGNWYVAIDSYDPPFDSRKEFAKRGRPIGLVNPHGKVPISSWYAGWHAAWLCPATEGVREITAELLLGALERGCTVVQIDNFPCGGSMPCYSRRHGHPRGHGPWYTASWRNILADVRRRAKAINPDAAITCEGMTETYIPYIDFYDHRGGNMEYFGHRFDGDPMGGEIIPLFQYVYGGYVGAYTAAYPECNRPEVLYWTRCLGKSLAQGVVPSGGRYWPEPKQSNPVTLAFYKQVVRAAANDCWKYIMFGEMLRPPRIKAPTIEAAYLRFTGECLDHLLPHNRHVVTDRAVQHGVWRAEDGTIGYIFVNVSQEPVAFDVELSAYGAKARDPKRDTSRLGTPSAYEIVQTVNGKRTRLSSPAKLPLKRRIELDGLSVMLVEIAPR